VFEFVVDDEVIVATSGGVDREEESGNGRSRDGMG
jgi:hypothetical protein